MDTNQTREIERRVCTSCLGDDMLEAITGIVLLQLGPTSLLTRDDDLEGPLMVLPLAVLLTGAIFAMRRFVVVPRRASWTFHACTSSARSSRLSSLWASTLRPSRRRVAPSRPWCSLLRDASPSPR